tara:strand:+ start:152 stop:490 length:339 start_codon:yes stop_codon:yes gene_type:complete
MPYVNVVDEIITRGEILSWEAENDYEPSYLELYETMLSSWGYHYKTYQPTDDSVMVVVHETQQVIYDGYNGFTIENFDSEFEAEQYFREIRAEYEDHGFAPTIEHEFYIQLR